MVREKLVRYAVRACLAGALMASIAVLASGCEEAFGGPTILSLTVTPDTITKNETGMTNEYFDVTIQVTGFEAEIEEVELFIAQPYRRAPNNPMKTTEIDGNTIRVENIQKTWFQGEEITPGTYNIGATVTDATGTSDTQRNLDQVEVTE